MNAKEQAILVDNHAMIASEEAIRVESHAVIASEHAILVDDHAVIVSEHAMIADEDGVIVDKNCVTERCFELTHRKKRFAINFFVIRGTKEMSGQLTEENTMNKWKFAVPLDDAGANDKYQQFRTNFAIHFSGLGFDAADLDAVLAAGSAFNTALINSNAAKDAMRNAVLVKNEARETTNEVIRTYVDRCILSPTATPEILADLGITPFSSSAGPVVPPVELSATPNVSGTARLKWGRGTNALGTVWVIEASVSGGPWEFMAISTKTAFVDTEATLNVPKLYRVRAQRLGVTSTPSNEAAIYTGGEGVSLELAA